MTNLPDTEPVGQNVLDMPILNAGDYDGLKNYVFVQSEDGSFYRMNLNELIARQSRFYHTFHASSFDNHKNPVFRTQGTLSPSNFNYGHLFFNYTTIYPGKKALVDRFICGTSGSNEVRGYVMSLREPSKVYIAGSSDVFGMGNGSHEVGRHSGGSNSAETIVMYYGITNPTNVDQTYSSFTLEIGLKMVPI